MDRRSAMDLPIRGDLMPLTISFPDIVDGNLDWLADKSVDFLIDKVVEALGGPHGAESGGFLARKSADLMNSDPNAEAAKAKLGEYIKIMAALYWPMLQVSWPGMARKVDIAKTLLTTAVESGWKSRLGRLDDDVKRLLLTANATALPLDTNLRVVRKKARLLYEEARRYYRWRGTLADAKIGNVFSGADPSLSFIISVPKPVVLRAKSIQMRILRQDDG